jgi:hypothetical protein
MSADRLARLSALARHHDPALARWLDDALRSWREEGVPFERALGLCGPDARKLRDALLGRLAELLDPSGRLSLWKRADLVRRAIRRGPGPRSGELGDVLRALAECGCYVPTSQRAVHSLLKNGTLHLQRETGEDSSGIIPERQLNGNPY